MKVDALFPQQFIRKHVPGVFRVQAGGQSVTTFGAAIFVGGKDDERLAAGVSR